MTRIGGIATALTAIAGVGWQYLETTPVRLGFDDTDDPALMVEFIRQNPAVFSQAGVLLVLMASAMVVSVLSVTPAVAIDRDGFSARLTTAIGLIGAGILLFGGGIRVGSSGPLLHMAGVSQASGEAAYVAAQVASQAALITGIVALCLWIVGLSVMGFRYRTLPALLCLLAVAPAYRVAGGLLGPLGLLPSIDVFWFLGILSIMGMFAWLLLLGAVLLRRGPGTSSRHEGPARVELAAIGTRLSTYCAVRTTESGGFSPLITRLRLRRFRRCLPRGCERRGPCRRVCRRLTRR